ncbi:MAG: CPBP family intramembrane glutamic endopeptidase [Lentisphaerota bacterium]
MNDSEPQAAGEAGGTVKNPGRLFFSVMGLFVGAVLLAALVAPQVFNLLLWMGRRFPSMENLRDLEFISMASRCVLFFLLAGLYPAMRIGGLRSWNGLGLGRGGGWEFVRAFCLGAGTMLVIYAAGLLVGAFSFLTPDWGEVAGKSAAYLAGALLVGLIEETVFRGALFGSLTRLVGFAGAALFSSVFFSSVHFMEPDPAIGTVYGHWYSGFLLFSQAFRAVSGGPAFPFCVTLFLMGMVLCAFYQYYGRLHFSIGLHAGWVWLMRISDYFIQSDDKRWEVLFGQEAAVPRSWVAVGMMSVYLIVALLLLRRRQLQTCPAQLNERRGIGNRQSKRS